MEQLSITPPYERYIKRHFSRIGLALITLIFAPSVVVGIISGIISVFSPSLLQTHSWLTVALSTLPMYLVGMPLAYLILRPMPKTAVVRRRVPVSQIFILFCLCCFAATVAEMVGAYLTSILNLLLSIPETDLLGTILGDLSPLPLFLLTVVLAPIFEELFFRKFLIDRIVRYGELPAILISGFLFGLFHGNLQQAPYAILLGFVFAFAYVKSGKLWYSILLHAMLNFFSGFLTLLLVPETIDMSLPALADVGRLLYLLAMLGFFIVGLVFLCTRFRKARQSLQEASVPNFGKLAFRNVGMILYLVLMAFSIVSALFLPVLMRLLEQLMSQLHL